MNLDKILSEAVHVSLYICIHLYMQNMYQLRKINNIKFVYVNDNTKI